MASARRVSQLSFARQIARVDSLSELNLLRQIYRLELGRQSPEREVLDLLAKAIEGHLHVRLMGAETDTKGPTNDEPTAALVGKKTT
jgi:hypothetical protein